MTPETIGITVTYKIPVTFHLRMIGVADESKLRQKMFGLTEDEQTEKAYENNVDMLADLSEQHPETLVNGKIEPYEFQNSPAGAIKKFFADRTVLKERIAEYAVLGYFARLKPDVSFL